MDRGLSIRLSAETELISLGNYLVVEGKKFRYLAMINDLEHPISPFGNNPAIENLSKKMRDLIDDELLQVKLSASLQLSRQVSSNPAGKYLPVATIPPIHSPVRLASSADIEQVFECPSQSGLVIGQTREERHPVAIDLSRLVQRSTAVFGSSGSGKTFLSRVLISGLIASGNTAVLIIDPHQEFAYTDIGTDTGIRVPGMKDIFGPRLRSVGLGKQAMIRNHPADLSMEIAYADVKVEDILLLDQQLSLPPTAATNLPELERRYGERNWFTRFAEQILEPDQAGDGIDDLSKEATLHKGSLKALKPKLGLIYNRPYLVKTPQRDTISEIIHSLRRGQSVVLSLPENNPIDYLFVTNILVRRICEAYGQASDAYRAGTGTEPIPLVIVVEEAHRMLTSTHADQTSFGELAREWRKQYITLMIIDQRPAIIDAEISSQIGTRFLGLLNDEKDIQAALAGLPGKDHLRKLISTLRAGEEMLVAGWGVPMPIIVRTRRYDDEFVRLMRGKTQPAK